MAGGGGRALLAEHPGRLRQQLDGRRGTQWLGMEDDAGHRAARWARRKPCEQARTALATLPFRLVGRRRLGGPIRGVGRIRRVGLLREHGPVLRVDRGDEAEAKRRGKGSMNEALVVRTSSSEGLEVRIESRSSKKISAAYAQVDDFD